ncbi:TonB family protein [Aliikangiella coralliicola]|uniref:Protein TonB n=1 Tax=Aliikangiella coralliicola TaxID=2592383 RepID=A0A545UJM2_9GAMM|nr:TonB family protein [Aliikangiella coralliicola]TQV89666.1 TonB family protein [Aliikangiella coralliicola]
MRKLFIILFLFMSSAVEADFNSALDSYGAGEHAKAYQDFLSMAQLGEKRSQFNLGVMYYHGQHVKKDLNKAYAWMKLAVEGETSKPQEKKIFQTIASKIEDKDAAEAEFNKLYKNYSTATLMKKLYPVIVKAENEHGFSADPVKIVDPKYPRKAAMSGAQGWVRFQMDVDKSGKPRNLHIIQSLPENLFVKDSVAAIKKWRFKPAVNEAGEPIMQKKLRYTIEFRLKGADEISVKKEYLEKAEKNAALGDADAQYLFGVWNKHLKMPKKENPNDWFIKAAIQGHTSAQFELGRSLIMGQGCISDRGKGIDWLTRSASSGQPQAKQLLASLAIEKGTQESQLKAVEYLSDVDDLEVSTAIDYAWMLATSNNKEIANPKKAIKIIKTLPSRQFWDEATLNEIKAAAHAAQGDFKKAVDYQEDALDEAEDMRVDLDEIKNRLSAYQKKKLWF